jgi:hypothetical protein
MRRENLDRPRDAQLQDAHAKQMLFHVFSHLQRSDGGVLGICSAIHGKDRHYEKLIKLLGGLFEGQQSGI